LSKTRQITNYIAKEKTSPKLEKVIDLIQKGTGPVLVYSNYINSGVTQIDKLIRQRTDKSSFVFSGSVTKQEKAKAVKLYNTGKLDVLLITASGSEGIDLKRTRQVIILEPHWNYSRIKQAIGRAIRYHSHINLNNNKRHVDVYHLISTFSQSMFNSKEKKLYKVSADTYLWDITQQKRRINEQFNDLLK
jgi:SNF2 family DNA or RNA helicase